MATLPADYLERVYAGVLGKVIGVYVGRPFEQWSHEAIEARFGEIDRYVAEEAGQPLIVADDDISGTFTFLRALEDFGPDLTPQQVAETWMNYLVEGRTVLWWGGMGMSTEHTAYLRLKQGVPAPLSGSVALNGPIVAQQIGAQIFIDGWGLVCPNDPEKAVHYARIAGSVSHDGEAIYGAQVVAAMVAMAFSESRIDALLDRSLEFIPADCLLREMIDDVRTWHAQGLDWRDGFAKIREKWGYERYVGGCHILPNHALIIHALLHGNGSFRESMRVVNTLGYDTDCNSANVGCILGVRGGLAAFEGEGYDWRGPVADRVLIPTADGGGCVTDCAALAYRVAEMGRLVADHKPTPRRPQFDFALPGSVQGWTGGEWTPDGLAIDSEASAPVFLQPDQLGSGGYTLAASPRLWPGQVLSWEADGELKPFVEVYDDHDQLIRLELTRTAVPDTGGLPIARVGFTSKGRAHLKSIDWTGTPTFAFQAGNGTAWRKAWVDAVSDWWKPFTLIHNDRAGLITTGTQDWSDLDFHAVLEPNLANEYGLAVRVQGMRRYVAILQGRDGVLRLIEENHGRRILGEVACSFAWGEAREFQLTVSGNLVTVRVNGHVLVGKTDLGRGGVGVLVDSGRIAARTIKVGPVQ